MKLTKIIAATCAFILGSMFGVAFVCLVHPPEFNPTYYHEETIYKTNEVTIRSSAYSAGDVQLGVIYGMITALEYTHKDRSFTYGEVSDEAMSRWSNTCQKLNQKIAP